MTPIIERESVRECERARASARARAPWPADGAVTLLGGREAEAGIKLVCCIPLHLLILVVAASFPKR